MDPLKLWGFVYALPVVILPLALWAETHLAPPTTARVKRALMGLSYATLPLVLFTSSEERLFKAIVSLASVFYTLKTREVLFEERFRKESLFIRILAVIGTFHDVQERWAGAPWFAPRLREVAKEALKVTIHGVGTWLTATIFVNRVEYARWVCAAARTEDFETIETVRIAIACVAGCFYSFFSLNVFGDFLALLFLAGGGFHMPPLMDAPYKSTSVRDFWKRWDSVIGKLLKKYVYEPLVKRRGFSKPTAAGFTFFVSGLVHVYPIVISQGFTTRASRQSAKMMSYFLIQFFAMFLEDLLGVVGKRERWQDTVESAGRDDDEIRRKKKKNDDHRPPREEANGTMMVGSGESFGRFLLGKLWTIFWLFGPSYVLVSSATNLILHEEL